MFGEYAKKILTILTTTASLALLSVSVFLSYSTNKTANLIYSSNREQVGSFKYNPFTGKLDYYSNAISSGGSSTSTPGYLSYYITATNTTGTPNLINTSSGIVFTNATGTNLFATNTVFLNNTSSNFAFINANGGNVTTTNLYASGSSQVVNLTSTNQFSSNLSYINLNGINATTTNLAINGPLAVTGSSTLASTTFTGQILAPVGINTAPVASQLLTIQQQSGQFGLIITKPTGFGQYAILIDDGARSCTLNIFSGGVGQVGCISSNTTLDIYSGGTSSRIHLDSVGNITFQQNQDQTSGTTNANYLTFTPGSYSNNNPTLNYIMYDFQAPPALGFTAGTTLPLETLTRFSGMATASSTVSKTMTNGMNVFVTGTLRAGRNMTITSSTALTIIGGPTTNGGTTTNAYGLWIQAPTGASKNYGLWVDGKTTLNDVVTTTNAMFATGISTSVTGDGVCRTASNELTDAGAAACIPSSIRYKENLHQYYGSAIIEIMRLRMVLGDYKKWAAPPHSTDSKLDKSEHFFLIAEQVAKIDPRLVDFNKNDQPETLNFDEFNALYARAFQEIVSIIIALFIMVILAIIILAVHFNKKFKLLANCI